MLRRNENVNKLRSFVDFAVPLNYNFELSTFPDRCKRRKMGRIEERWDDPSKAAEFLGSAEEWHHVSSEQREREASLLHSLSLGVQRIEPRPSIQPIINLCLAHTLCA